MGKLYKYRRKVTSLLDRSINKGKQCDKNSSVEFLIYTMNQCKKLTDKPLLVRLGSGIKIKQKLEKILVICLLSLMYFYKGRYYISITIKLGFEENLKILKWGFKAYNALHKWGFRVKSL